MSQKGILSLLFCKFSKPFFSPTHFKIKILFSFLCQAMAAWIFELYSKIQKVIEKLNLKNLFPFPFQPLFETLNLKINIIFFKNSDVNSTLFWSLDNKTSDISFVSKKLDIKMPDISKSIYSKSIITILRRPM